jgi:integrase/recombinase XerC
MKFLKIEADRFLDYIKKTRTINTYNTYKTVLEEALKNIEVEDNIIDITPYRLKIARLNKKTIAKKVSTLRSFFDFLKREGYKFKIIGDEQIKVPKTLPKPISIEHIKEALQKAEFLEYVAIMVIFSLGLRISEAANIKLKDIKNDWIEIKGKGNKTRMVPLYPKLKEIINKYLSIYNPKEYLFEKD